MVCLSRVWLQTELEDTKSLYYQLIIKIKISEKRRIAKLWKKGQICIRILTNEALFVSCRSEIEIGWSKPQLWMWLVDLNYNFECDWLIELSDNRLSSNKLSDNNLESELVEIRVF